MQEEQKRNPDEEQEENDQNRLAGKKKQKSLVVSQKQTAKKKDCEEEIRRRKALELKVKKLEALLRHQQEQLDVYLKLPEKSTEETAIQGLKEKYKFAYNSEQYPWMYNIESLKSEKQKIEWLQEWANFVIDYAKTFIIHVIDVVNLLTQQPFSDFKQNRERYLKDIMNYLATQTTIAEWIDKAKTRLRLYWRSLEEWSEKLYDYMFIIGTEIVTLIDIKNTGAQIAEGFVTLPSPDLKRIIDLLVKDKKANWIDKKSVKFCF
jgi:vacuolar-type H+-ATPase subunit I/STV1